MWYFREKIGEVLKKLLNFDILQWNLPKYFFTVEIEEVDGERGENNEKIDNSYHRFSNNNGCLFFKH
jgi:hypothetical protein